MNNGVPVIGDDDNFRRIDVAAAVLRATGFVFDTNACPQ